MNNFKLLRDSKELSQENIADLLMCDQSLYSKYEREEREIPLRLAVKLADFYEVTLDYLIGRNIK